MSHVDGFRVALRNLYESDPCKLLPNAIWKTGARLPVLQYSYESDHDEIVNLKAWDQEGLHIFWNKSRKVDEILDQLAEASRFMIIHEDYYRQIDVKGYSVIKPFFRVKHDARSIPAYSVPSGFYIKEADPNKETIQISDLITKCYKDLQPSPDTVRSWTTHAVFDRSLWIWIMDKRRNKPAGLGIAEFDRSIPEGSLEWIQVLPEYQGRGLGSIPVILKNEL